MGATTLLLAAAVLLAAEVPAEVTLTGKIREVTGTAEKSRALLITPEGEEVVVVGRTPEDTGELLRVSGMSVAVRGVRAGPSLAVSGYEIVDAGDGAKPRIGIIGALDVGGERRLVFVDQDGEADLLPAGWMKKMGGQIGSKAWVIGKRTKDGFKIIRFGILRPKTEGA